MVTTQPQSIHRHTQQPHAGAQEISLVSCFVSVRLRARTPSGGSGPRTAAALRTLTREQLRVRAGVGKPPPPPGATPFFDGRAYGPPLCGGTPPATPPSKALAAHQSRRGASVCVISPLTPRQRRTCLQPLTTIHYPLSTDHRPLQFHRSSRYQPCGFSSLSPPPKRASPDPRT